ncbi:hypothetical protein glysoja_012818, partial [Glycine soja]
SQNIKQVSWNLFIQGWTKCNIDGAAKGNPSARCGGIFRNDRACALGCFTLNLRTQNSLFAELMGVILAIELVAKKNWSMLWLESNCIHLTKSMHFQVGHIYKEGNTC